MRQVSRIEHDSRGISFFNEENDRLLSVWGRRTLSDATGHWFALPNGEPL